jgi:hypothetical protein
VELNVPQTDATGPKKEVINTDPNSAKYDLRVNRLVHTFNMLLKAEDIAGLEDEFRWLSNCADELVREYQHGRELTQALAHKLSTHAVRPRICHCVKANTSPGTI